VISAFRKGNAQPQLSLFTDRGKGVPIVTYSCLMLSLKATKESIVY